jgi:hypothetical protein
LSFLSVRENRLQDTFAILDNLIIPEAKDFPTLALEIGVSGLVARAFGVLEAVGFDDQLGANAKKVDNIRSDRNLSAKLDPTQATIAQ